MFLVFIVLGMIVDDRFPVSPYAFGGEMQGVACGVVVEGDPCQAVLVRPDIGIPVECAAEVILQPIQGLRVIREGKAAGGVYPFITVMREEGCKP